MMAFVAVCVDGLQAILSLLFVGIVLNPFIDVIAWIVFAIWFYHLGIKKYAGLTFAGIVEFIPVINTFPVWTGYIGSMIAITKLKQALASNR